MSPWRVARIAALSWTCCSVGCGSGAPWSADPSPSYDDSVQGPFQPPEERRVALEERYRVRAIGRVRPENPVENPEVVTERIAISRTSGKVLGDFRNTYYDFPSEEDFTGEMVALYDAACSPISRVPQGFHDSVCVQGSGVLRTGTPVSFAKRNCSCARTCPRTKQKICFDPLDKRRFPWGRGATGKAITPLLTVAVDSTVIPLETPLYIPEYEGLPIDEAQQIYHDGCFIAQDRGMKVKGKHVDIFTGEPSLTRIWNRLVPSNKGVTVVLDSPKCARVKTR